MTDEPLWETCEECGKERPLIRYALEGGDSDAVEPCTLCDMLVKKEDINDDS